MSKTFECNTIEDVDASGVLQAIGCQWNEEASWRASKRILYLVAVPVTIIAYLTGLLMIMTGIPGLIVLGMAVGLHIYLWKFAKGELPIRSVIFHRDGPIETPQAVPGEKTALWLKLRSPQIANIEIGPSFSGMQADWTNTVTLVSKSGQTVTVSQLMHQEEAREVVATLVWALMVMRQSIGNERGVRKSVETTMARPLVN